MAYAGTYAPRNTSNNNGQRRQGRRPQPSQHEQDVATKKDKKSHHVPDGVFVETNAVYEIGGVAYLAAEVFDRKHSVYDAIATGIGRTSAHRDVFEHAKSNSRQAVIRAINNCIQNYARYPSFQEECRTCMNAVNSPSINSVDDLKNVMVGNALRNEIQIEVMHATCLDYKVQVTNVKL